MSDTIVTYRDQVQRSILRLLDDVTKTEPDAVVDFRQLAQEIAVSLNDVDDGVSALAIKGYVRVMFRDVAGGGLVHILAAGQDILADPIEPDERVDLRARVLRWLYERARHDRHASTRIAEIAANLNADERPVFAAARYLEQNGYAQVRRLGTKPGEPIVSITSEGQDAVDHPVQPTSDSRAAVTHVTFNAPVGQSIIGGEGHTQSAQQIVFSHETQDIMQMIGTIREALGTDAAMDPYVKDDAQHALETLEGEIIKAPAEQNGGRIAHAMQRLKEYAPGTLALLTQLEMLINNRPHF